MDRHAFASTFARENVDKKAGVIRGVAVATEGPASGNIDKELGLPFVFDAKTLAQIMACAKTYVGGLKVRADHGSGIFATSGYLDNFRIDGKILRADLHALETDENRDKLMEMAEIMPDTFGISVVFSGASEVSAGKALARCVEIYCADLVNDPAANHAGLFSVQIDQSPKCKTMSTEPDLIKQCEAMLAKFAAECATKFAAFESVLTEMKTKGQLAQFEALQTKIVALETKTADLTLHQMTVESVAKEFAKVVGISPSPGSTPAAGGPPANEPKLADVGEALVQKHFAATKSRTKAFELAGQENGKAVEALITSQRKVSYEKKAA